MHTLTPEEIARHVVGNPERYCRMPAVLGAQWARLKEARGQKVNFGLVGDPAYQIAGPDSLPKPVSLADHLAERAPRISAACARRKPRFAPPLGGVPA